MDARLLERLNGRCDCVVSSCSTAGLPSVCWGMGSQVEAHGRRATVWVAREQARQLLSDVVATGRIAVAYSEPLTNFGMQIKGRDARVRDSRPADGPVLQRHLANMVREISAVGLSSEFVQAAFQKSLAELVAIEWVIEARFSQTPGPGAGQAMVNA